ncbi:MAG: 50S ribosomal protein L15 [Leptospiraceae bacterium]|nr:50S ribosomal protein L15 [Leptospiraceae bacterium]MDW8306064.1 50S ribosomal protein L15 [Leptospiraceae bacterium]
MKLDIKPRKGANRPRKRVGRGTGSGLGKTSGRGGKGQTARTGGKIPARFEGGQQPLYKRLPKRGFSNSLFRRSYVIVNLGKILKALEDKKLAPGEIKRETLLEAGLIAKKKLPVKLLAHITEKEKKISLEGITLEVDAASAKARQLVEELGGKLVLKGGKPEP